jgi:hypothetical protein
MNADQPDLARLEEAANLAASATQAAAAVVSDLESKLAAARAEMEAAKEREMEARRAFTVAEDAQRPASQPPA